METLTGVAASPGVAEGTVWILVRDELAFDERRTDDVDGECARFSAAAAGTAAELHDLVDRIRREVGVEAAHIIRSQQTVAEDDAFLSEVAEVISERKLCAEAALRTVLEQYRSLFGELDDEAYNKGRLVDIEDVFSRILRHLLGREEHTLAAVPAGTVIVADELYPSDTAAMDSRAVVALVTEGGGPTSHASILAKNLGIPAAVQVGRLLDATTGGSRIIVETATDGVATVTVDPDEAALGNARDRARLQAARSRSLAAYRGLEPRTRDGALVTLSANVGSTRDLAPARAAGARSVGLYRTEFLFLGRPTLPDEEEQYTAYRTAVETFHDTCVIFRTLDIGGDKRIDALPQSREANPALGGRALRLMLTNPELFRTQLRAILRASAHGPARIMFPMVGGTAELSEALTHLDACRAGLDRDGVAWDREMPVGIMIEIPAAVLAADALARRVDFFSIGTNDLTQYLLAADRLNPAVSRYYRRYDPSVFEAIGQVCAAAARHGRWTGVCGELGGDPLAIPVLLGLGVTELSMSPLALDEATSIVRTGAMADFARLAARVRATDTHEEIDALLREHAHLHLPGDA